MIASAGLPGYRLRKNGKTTGWIVALFASAVILAGAFFFRGGAELADDRPMALPRTLLLAEQKQESLRAYNDEMTMDDLLKFYRQHTGSDVDAKAFQRLSEHIVNELMPVLWPADVPETSNPLVGEQALSRSQENVVRLIDVSKSIRRSFPHQTLTNADVILFPDSSDLRIVISEPATDFFRDTGWHWRWIEEYIRSLTPREAELRKELDAYAAEELSEFLSVLGVGVIELAAENASESGRVDAAAIDKVFARFSSYTPDVIASRNSEIAFSQESKDSLLKSLPDPMFRDVSQELGITFRHRPDPANQRQRTRLAIPLGIAGGGVSAGDFDSDGFTDLYFAGSNGGALYRNEDGASFTDVTRRAGLEVTGETRAGYFVDYDNDGDDDLFLTVVGQPNVLLQNDGNGTFEDVTDSTGLESGNEITHEAVWFDMDNDGLLDLYTANFGDWYHGAVPTLGRRNNNAPPNRLYKQVLDGSSRKFIEIGKSAGVQDQGWTHCVGAYDFDRDGLTDLFSLNDFGASLVYRNIDGRKFEEVSRQLRLDDIYNAMSFTLMDLNHNGDQSIYISQIMKLTHRQRYSKPTENTSMTFDPDTKGNIRVLVNNRLFTRAFGERYRDDHDFLLEPAKLGWAWDASAMDYENDSDVDLFIMNGTESAIPASPEFGFDAQYVNGRNYLSLFDSGQNVCYAQQDGYFYDVSAINPIAFSGNSRGTAFLDFDLDGDLDVAVSNYDATPRLYENLQNSSNNWIRFKLIGTESNRNAIGADIEIQMGDEKRYSTVVSGSGFLSQNPYECHFGLGNADAVDLVKIRWPTGVVQEMEQLEVNQRHVIQEPAR